MEKAAALPLGDFEASSPSSRRWDAPNADRRGIIMGKWIFLDERTNDGRIIIVEKNFRVSVQRE